MAFGGFFIKNFLKSQDTAAYLEMNQKKSTLEINIPVTAQPSQKFSNRLFGVRMILGLFDSSRM